MKALYLYYIVAIHVLPCWATVVTEEILEAVRANDWDELLVRSNEFRTIGDLMMISDDRNRDLQEEETMEFIDFRDLMLPAAESIAMGGSGRSYGDVVELMFSMMKSMLLSTTEENELVMNEIMIRPFTEAQSGTPGLLLYPKDVIDFKSEEFLEGLNTSSLVSFVLELIPIQMRIRVYNLKMQNVDVVVPPMALLEPTRELYTLQNVFNMGPVADKSMNVSFTVLLEVYESDIVPFKIHNEVEISFQTSWMHIFMETVAKISIDRFLQFRLSDILELPCWLRVMPSPQLDEDGFRVEGSPHRGLSLRNFVMSMSNMEWDYSCRNCTINAGSKEVPTVLDILQEAGVTDILHYRTEELIQDIMLSDMVQAATDRSIHNAPFSCPSAPEYNLNVAEKASRMYPSLPPVLLSAQAIDTMIFSAFIMSNVFYAIMANDLMELGTQLQSQGFGFRQLLSEDETTDESITSPMGTTWVDFTNLNDQFGTFVDSIFHQARAMFSSSYTVKDTGRQDIGANLLIQLFFFPGGIYQASKKTLSAYQWEMQGLYVSVDAVRVEGLDSISNIDLLKPTSPHTLDNQITLDNLTINIQFTVGQTARSAPPAQKISVTVGLKDIRLASTIFVAIDANKQADSSLTIGSLLGQSNTSVESIICMLQQLDDLRLDKLQISLGRIDPNEVTVDGLWPDTDEALSKTMTTILSRYGYLINVMLPLVSDMLVREGVNSIIKEIMSMDMNCSSQDHRIPPSEYVDFIEFFNPRGIYGLSPALARVIMDMVLEFVNPKTNWPIINDAFVGPITKDISGVYGQIDAGTEPLLNMTLTPADIRIPTLGIKTIDILIFDAKIENLNSIDQPFRLLEDYGDGLYNWLYNTTMDDSLMKQEGASFASSAMHDERYLLDHIASIGLRDRPLRAGARFVLAMSTPKSSIHNDFEVSVELQDIQVALTTFVKLSQARLLDFPLSDIADWNCWLAMIQTPALDERGVRLDEESEVHVALSKIVASLARARMNVHCFNCTGPALKDFEQLSRTQESSNGLTNHLRLILAFIVQQLGGDFVQDQTDQLLNQAAKRCPHSPEYDAQFAGLDLDPLLEMSYPSHLNLEVVAIFLILLFVVVVSSTYMFTMLRVVPSRYVRRIGELPPNHLRKLKAQQEVERMINIELNNTMTSLFDSVDIIPAFVRYLFPVIIVGNIGFFLSGHLSMGFAVLLDLEVMGEVVDVGTFNEFALAPAMAGMFHTNLEAIAISGLLVTAVWPYVKQLISLILWFTPPKTVSVQRRLSVYLWFDFLAKWSMVDIFVIIGNITAIFLSITSPSFISYLPQDMFGIRLVVVPQWGLFANLTAQLISQVTSHFIIYYTRKCERIGKEMYEQNHKSLSEVSGALELSSCLTSPVSSDDSHAALKSTDGINKKSSNSTYDNYKLSDTYGLNEKMSDNVSQGKSSGGTPSDGTPSDGTVDKLSVVTTTETCSSGESSGKTAVATNHNNKNSRNRQQRSMGWETSPKNVRVCLYKHEFMRPYKGVSDRLAVHGIINLLFALIVIMTCVLLASGSTLIMFTNRIYGVIGLAIAFVAQQEKAEQDVHLYDILEIMTDIADVSSSNNKVGIYSFMCLLFLTVVVVPVLLALALAFQWFYPLTRSARKKVISLIEVLLAWQYADVFMFSMMLMAWQLEYSTIEILKDICEPYNEYLVMARYYGLVESNDAQCLQMDLGFRIGSMIVIAGILLLYFLGYFVNGATAQYIEETDQSYQKLLDEAEEEEERRGSLVDVDTIDPGSVKFTDMLRFALKRTNHNNDHDDYVM